MSVNKPTSRLHALIPAELHKAATDLAAMTGITLTELLIHSLRMTIELDLVEKADLRKVWHPEVGRDARVPVLVRIPAPLVQEYRENPMYYEDDFVRQPVKHILSFDEYVTVCLWEDGTPREAAAWNDPEFWDDRLLKEPVRYDVEKDEEEEQDDFDANRS